MRDRSYYQLRKYLAANFKCDLDCPTIKTVLEALDACNFIAAYYEIRKMIFDKMQTTILNMVVQRDPVMDIKLRACKNVIVMAESDPVIMDFAMKKNLDFACCSRSSYGDCLIALLANISLINYDNAILKQLIKLSKAIYRSDYNLENITQKFPEASAFIQKYARDTLLQRVRADAEILENEWIS